MTPEALQYDWLSLRYWLRRCVLPSALVLLVIMAALKLTSETASELDHKAVLPAFFTLYYVLVRGGHILMIRSLHRDLLKTYAEPYREILSRLDPKTMKRRNIGFTLARIKRKLIDDKRAKQNLNNSQKHHQYKR